MGTTSEFRTGNTRPAVLKVFAKTKNLKNISKTFQKPIDKSIFVCYNIITLRATPQEGEGKMKIIITVKDTDNIIGLKEDIAMRLEGVADIVRIDVEAYDDRTKALH